MDLFTSLLPEEDIDIKNVGKSEQWQCSKIIPFKCRAWFRAYKIKLRGDICRYLLVLSRACLVFWVLCIARSQEWLVEHTIVSTLMVYLGSLYV